MTRSCVRIGTDNIDLNRTTLVTKKPAPREGDPLHYRTFLQKICDAFERRWVK